MDYRLKDGITIVEQKRKKHSKASEDYIHVKFDYKNNSWDGWVPVEYRRTGVSIKPEEQDCLYSYLIKYCIRPNESDQLSVVVEKTGKILV